MGDAVEWKGSVQFGLVNVPVKLYLATEAHDVGFRQVRRSDGSRIRYRRVAEADGEEVDYQDIAKGFELPTGEMLVLTDTDMAELPLPSKQSIEVLQFTPWEQIDPILLNRSYFIEPDGGRSVKAYLLQAMESSELAAVVKVTIGNRERVAVIRVREELLVLHTVLWQDEVRVASFPLLDQGAELRPQELAMAQSLIATMTDDFDLSVFSDEYTEAMRELIEVKAAGEALPEAATPAAAAAQVGDLLATLQRSIDATRGTPTKAAAVKTASTKKTAAKKAPAAKKATVKKAVPAKRHRRRSPRPPRTHRRRSRHWPRCSPSNEPPSLTASDRPAG